MRRRRGIRRDVGGSAIAMGWGLRDRNRKQKIISVELGGKYEHPTVGTDDIVRDLAKNIKKYEMAAYPEIVVGNSRDPQIVRKVHDLVAGVKLGLLCMDSDGDVRADFELYRHLLDSNAYLIIDDYFSPGAPEKRRPNARRHRGTRAQGNRGKPRRVRLGHVDRPGALMPGRCAFLLRGRG